MSDTLHADPVEITKALRATSSPEQVFEIRMLDVKQSYGALCTMGGYFDYDHIPEAAKAVVALESSARGVYFTPNPCVPDLLARIANRIERRGKGDPLTTDKDILSRRFFLIDCDPVRPSGISSNDAEHEAAHEMAKSIRAALSADGWPDPVYTDSGNGAQLMYRVDLPAADDGLLERATKSLAAKFNIDTVHVDETVHNAARIWRLPGTINRKGDHISTRPHRMARVLNMPEKLEIVPREKIEAVCETKKPSEAPTNSSTLESRGWTQTDVERLIQEHLKSSDAHDPEPYMDGVKWVLGKCPFDENHTGGSAAIFWTASGRPGFKCHHDSCKNYQWGDLLDKCKANGPVFIHGKPVVYLPHGDNSINAAGRELGKQLGATNKFFIRGGVIVRMEVDDRELPSLLEVKPAELASDFELIATLMIRGKKGAVPSTCNETTAKLISCSAAFREEMPVIRVLARCPVLIERDGELITIYGYDRQSGVMAGGEPVVEMSLDEACSYLNELVKDYHFASESDRARALAAFISPAMTLSGLLPGRAPIDLAEADDSQAGKGYRMKVKTAIYHDIAKSVTQKKDGGVGSLEEAFNSALIRGASFINIDNARGKIDSPAIESFMTEDSYTARAAYSHNMEIDPRRIVVSLTSNKADLTVDMANRCACVRILKQPIEYKFKKYPEGDLLDHVHANKALYLGAVFAVIRAWYKAGRPRTDECRHDFRAWAQIFDWITQHLLKAGPLMDGHRDVQERMTNPVLNWLRDVALTVKQAKRFNECLRTRALVELLVESGVKIPGLSEGEELNDPDVSTRVLQATGRQLGQCFRNLDKVSFDGIIVKRLEAVDPVIRHPVRVYEFSAPIVKQDGSSLDASIGASIAAAPAGGMERGQKQPPDGVDCAYDAEKSTYCAPKAAPEETPIASNAPDTQAKVTKEVPVVHTTTNYGSCRGSNRCIGAETENSSTADLHCVGGLLHEISAS